MKTMAQKIRKIIEDMLMHGGTKQVIIYPFGDIGMSVKNTLNMAYGVMEDYIVDNHLCMFNHKLVELLLAKNFELSQIYTFESNKKQDLSFYTNQLVTKIGKYSYGPICVEHHPLIEEIGAFCCFAYGVEVVPNHEMKYITTHDILYLGKQHMGIDIPYECFEGERYFLEGIKPKDCVTKRKRNKIGNDVWLGRNVTITNGANIGNGVIAGAGAVITKDVPDYAVVVGVPARIIRFRYTNMQIEALNRIAWWNWEDDKIRKYYDDLYLPIEKFIEKHDCRG